MYVCVYMCIYMCIYIYVCILCIYICINYVVPNCVEHIMFYFWLGLTHGEFFTWAYSKTCQHTSAICFPDKWGNTLSRESVKSIVIPAVTAFPNNIAIETTMTARILLLHLIIIAGIPTSSLFSLSSSRSSHG